MDARAIADFVKSSDKIDKNRVFLVGRSLGGAVALHLLSEPEYQGVFRACIIENTFTSMLDMAMLRFMLMRMFPWLKMFLTIKWDNI